MLSVAIGGKGGARDLLFACALKAAKDSRSLAKSRSGRQFRFRKETPLRMYVLRDVPLKNCHPAVSAVNVVIAITRQRRSKGSAVRLRLESCKRQQMPREKPLGKTISFQDGNPS